MRTAPNHDGHNASLTYRDDDGDSGAFSMMRFCTRLCMKIGMKAVVSTARHSYIYVLETFHDSIELRY